MSDIIFTPPASSGGTTINPSNNVIPVRLDPTTFIDSNIENDANNYLKTSITPTSGDYFGLFIDFGTLISNLGDINFSNGTILSVDDANQVIKTQNQGNNIGLNLDFGNSVFKFGDFNNILNNNFLVINDSTGVIFLGNGNGDTTGLSYNTFGSIDGSCNIWVGSAPDNYGLSVNIDYTTLNLNFTWLISKYNVFLNSNNDGNILLQSQGTNSTSLLLDSLSDKMTFTTNNLNYVGTSLISASSGGSSGKHLVITLNGNQYKIELKNP